MCGDVQSDILFGLCKCFKSTCCMFGMHAADSYLPGALVLLAAEA